MLPRPEPKITGKDFVFADGVVQRRDQVFFRDGSLFEKFFQQGVIAFGHQFHQFFVLGLGFVFHVGGNLDFFSLAVAAQFVGVGLQRHQIDHAAEVFLFADGQFEWNHGSAEGIGQRFQNAFGVGAIAIHAAGHDQARRLIFLAVVPHPLGDDFHAGHAIHDDDRRIHHRQHQLGFVDEHVEAGRIHDIDLRFAPLHVGQAGGNRHLAGDFFLVVIGGRGAVVHAAQALVGARRVQHGGNQRGLACVSVPNHRNIPDIRAFVNLHGFAPSENSPPP